MSNTCQFFRPNRGEENRKMIAAEKRMKGERGRVGGGRGTEEEEENGIDLTLRE